MEMRQLFQSKNTRKYFYPVEKQPPDDHLKIVRETVQNEGVKMDFELKQRIWVSLQKSRRYIDFPWKVRELGCLIGSPKVGGAVTPNGSREITQLPNKLEFCIRISPSTETVRHLINGKEYINTYPHIQVKLPLEDYFYESQDTRDAFFIIYSPELADEFRKKGLLDDILCWDIQITPDILALLNKLRDMMAHALEFSVADKIDLLAFLLLEELFFQKKAHTAVTDMMSGKIEKIASYFQLHFADNLSMAQIAAEHGLSRSTFFRHWNRRFDLSPTRYVITLRLNEAKRLLKETNRSIEEIAYSLNFCDPAYFCSAFKREFKMTPVTFRNSNSFSDTR